MVKQHTLEQARDSIQSIEDTHISLVDLGTYIMMSPRTLAEQIKRGKIAADLVGNRYRVPIAEALRLLEANASKIEGWERLVDACREAGIHRNIGESICRQTNTPCAIDLNGHMRIPLAGRHCIEQWVADKASKHNWVRKTDFADSIGEHPTLVDTVCRKLGLPIDHDMSGMVTLSPEAQQGFLTWRERRDLHRVGEITKNGRTYYSLLKAAESAASYFAEVGTPEFDRIAKTYYRRFAFWIQEGLPYTTIKGKKYFSKQVYQALTDDLSVAEAARVAGVCKTTIKSWIRAGAITTRKTVAKRRSLSKKQFTKVLAQKYATSPVLKKKEMIPVKILPELETWSEKLQLRGPDCVLAALAETTGIPVTDLAPLRTGSGIVPRSVLRTYEEWSLRRAGGLDMEIRPDYQGFAADRIHELARTILDQRIVAGRDALCRLIAVYTGSSTESAAEWLFDHAYEGFLNFDLGELLQKMIEHQGATIYADHLPFHLNDLLIHPHAQDFGTVTQVVDHKAIRVTWKNLGTVSMAHAAGAPVEQVAMAHG